MNLVLPILNLLLIAAAAVWFFRRQPDALKRVYWAALAVKLLAGVAMGWLYLYHYGSGDTISFWQDGIRLADAFKERPGQTLAFLWDEELVQDLQHQFTNPGPRSLFFTKICGVLALLSHGNYWIMGAWMSVIAFAASWLLTVRLVRLFPEMSTGIALVLLFLPSVVFWSSGLIKESLGLAALYIIATAVISVVQQQVRVIELLAAFAALWIGWNLKYYWVGIFIPVAIPVVALAVAGRWWSETKRYDLALWSILVLASVAMASQSHPNFYFSRFLEVICQNNLEFTRLSDPPRLVQYYNLEPSFGSVLMNAPAALIAGLFRPFPWETFNTLSLLSALENLIVLAIVIQALPSVARMGGSNHRVLVIATLTYTLSLVVFLALSTPNFGTLSRYRIGALPFLLLVCLSSTTPIGRWLSRRRWFG